MSASSVSNFTREFLFSDRNYPQFYNVIFILLRLLGKDNDFCMFDGFISILQLRKDADELLRLAMLTEIENVKRILTSEATRLVQAAEAEEKRGQTAQKKVLRPAFTTTKLYNYGKIFLIAK